MNRRGFTLLEVLVATVIMGVAVTGLIVGLSQSAKNASRLSEYDRAVMLARTKMNDLLLDISLPFDGAVDGTFDAEQSGGMQSGWRAVLKPFEQRPNSQPGSEIVQRISLQIWWQPPSGTRRMMQLDGYRSARIPPAANP